MPDTRRNLVKPPRGFRHSGKTIKRARELSAAGWKCVRIAQLITREVGHPVSPATIRRWVDPERRARDVAKQSRRNREVLTLRRSGRLGSDHHTTQFQEHRARTLLSDGFGVTTVARLMRLDYPNAEPRWTVARVRIL